MVFVSLRGLAVNSIVFLFLFNSVHLTNITIISFTTVGVGLDGFIPNDPVYDIVIKRLKRWNPVTFANINHISVRCYNDSLAIGSTPAPADFASSWSDAYDDFLEVCLFRFYYLYPKLFAVTSLDRQFVVITSPAIAGSIGDLARVLPEISGMLALALADNRLADNTVYPTTLNVYGTPVEHYPFSLAVLGRTFNWTNGVNLVCGDRQEPTFVRFHCENFGFYIQDPHNKAFRNMPFERYYVDYSPDIVAGYQGNISVRGTTNFSDVFSVILNRRCAVLLLAPPLVRDFMIEAHRRNVTGGDYVFVTFAVQGAPSQNDIFWQAGDQYDTIAAEAFRALLIIQEVNATDWNGSDIFVQELYDQYQIRYPNWSISYSQDLAISFAVKILEWMYIIAANIGSSDLSTVGYADFVRGCANKTYDLPTRNVFLNARGTMIIPTYVYRLDEDRVFKPFITVDYRAATLEFITVPNWFGTTSLPNEIPPCGLRNEKCSDEADAAHVAFFSVGTSGLVVCCYVFQRYIRRKILKSQLSDLLIERSQVEVLYDLNDNVSVPESMDVRRSPRIHTSRMGLRWPQPRPKNRTLSVPSDVSKLSYSTGTLGQPAVYRDKDIFLKVLSDGQSMGDLIRNTKFSNNVVHASRLRHQYVAEFIGICHDRSLISAMFERPAKGSLKMLLEDNVFFHDFDLRLTLFANLVEGLHFIHTTGLRYHGSLSSDACLINNRYTIRIAMAGLHHLAVDLDHNHRRICFRNLCSSNNLTTALSYQKNDVEKLGIIMDEMFGEFASEPVTSGRILVVIQQLAASCKNPDATMRPSATEMHKKTKALNIGQKSAVELLLSRFQKHAEQLEQEVALRSEELATETKKVDGLLNEMLPKAIIEKLRNQIPIVPEMYDSATVLFSDIPVFARLATECSPMDVIFFLSQIHSKFDEIVSEFDAYKVETINDSYVVVSGIPVRNENHAGIICRLAQHFLLAGGSISIPALGDIIASPRIGINSGLAAAGVIGTRMPRYCLFGDTVNTASRMESHGQANRIHVSSSTRDLVTSGGNAAEFKFVSRGVVSIKSKGFIETFWLCGEYKIVTQI